ncbi:receptor-like protein 9DC1 [Solanum stenotomum]|uniref:receptor-like protein 9DC1 n=1 Tax=Solanum stenotomum TaxID=172797 RepID=UPI0020D0D33B|nr:receptor-like protein 9DC1 [Solanum stenotomum]
MGELTTGTGLHQELGLIRAGDTRWGSHYKSFSNFILMFGSIVDVLDALVVDAYSTDEKAKATGYLEACQTFKIAFMLHLMRDILGITDELNKSLQNKEQDIANVMLLVEVVKRRLQMLRDDGWDALINKVSTFCIKYNILLPNFDEPYVNSGRSRRKPSDYTVLHHYRVEVFCKIIDWQLQELNDRFNEVTTDLLHGVACLNPIDSFFSFNIRKIMRMAKLYPDDFDEFSMNALENQLATYIIDVRDMDERFSNLNGLCDLSRKLVETKKNLNFPLVFCLVKFALLLPVATASVERAFSTMKFIKIALRNRMNDELLSDRFNDLQSENTTSARFGQQQFGVSFFENFEAMKIKCENSGTREYVADIGSHYYINSLIVTTKGLDVELPRGHTPALLHQLSALESLDLSSNKISGEIPQQLASLTSLEVLNLSHNHLVGCIPKGKQFDTFENSSYQGNDGLHGFPLSKDCGGGDGVAQTTTLVELDQEEGGDSSMISWQAVLTGYSCGLFIGLSIIYIVLSTQYPTWFSRMDILFINTLVTSYFCKVYWNQ